MTLVHFSITDDKPALKNKYKELAKKYHPDVHGEAGNAIMQDIHTELDYCMKYGNAKPLTGQYTWMDLVNEIMEDINQRKPAINTLGDVLREPMLSFWSVLVKKAKATIHIPDDAVPRVNKN